MIYSSHTLNKKEELTVTPIFPSFVIKRHAKLSMRGNFFKALGASMLPALIISLIAVIVMLLPPVSNVINLSVKGMFENSQEQMLYSVDMISKLLYGVNLLLALFYFLIIGGEKINLDIVRGKKAKLKTMFAFYDKWYIACIWPVLTLLLSIGGDMAISAVEKSAVHPVGLEVFVWVWQLVTLIISVKTMFIPYVLADSECKSFTKAFLKSWKLVNIRTMVSIFLLYISFIGWFVLVFFTGFAIIYVYPYLRLSMATIYHLTVTNTAENQ